MMPILQIHTVVPFSKKATFSFLLLCIVQFSFAQVNFDEKFTEKISLAEQRNRKLSADGVALANSSNYDLTSATISIFPLTVFSGGELSGSVKYILHRIAGHQIEFDLRNNMHVINVVFNGLATTFSRRDDVLAIDIPAGPIAMYDTVTITYSGTVSSSGFGSFGNMKQGSDSVPVLWTLSEPYGARDWMPCKMTLTDKLDSFDIFIQARGKYKGISNGILQATIPVPNGDTLYHWHHSYPIATYLICMAVTNYDTFTRTANTVHGDLPIHFYCYPESKTEWESDAFNVTNSMLFFDSLFGGYPFARDHYGQTQFSWGGGIEHQSNSFMYNVFFELASHELGHQWFGDKLTCGSWQEIWLNEGFATYCSALAYQHIQPQYWDIFLKYKQEGACSIKDGCVMVDDTTSVSRIFSSQLSYSKGAYILHMLRGQMGDSLFFTALRSYLNDPQLMYQFTTTNALRSHFERVTGISWVAFFDKWVYKKGFPSYQLLWSDDTKEVVVQLHQTTSDTSVSFFAMHTPLYFKGSGWDTTIWVNHEYSGQKWSWRFGHTVDSVFIDPERWILAANNTVVKVPDVNDESKVVLFPNPASQELNIFLNAQAAETFTVSVFDMQGKQVLSDQTYSHQYIISIDISAIPHGAYTCKVLTGKNYLKSVSFLKR